LVDGVAFWNQVIDDLTTNALSDKNSMRNNDFVGKAIGVDQRGSSANQIRQTLNESPILPSSSVVVLA